MTRREFDAVTKWDYGAHMAGDTKESYRRERAYVIEGYDYVTFRARVHARRNANPYHRDGFLPVLARGSAFRAPQAWRAKEGRSMLRLGGEP